MLLYMPVEAADVVKFYSWDREIIPDYLLGSIQAQESFIFFCWGEKGRKGKPEIEN